jgi:hypothetical protein
MEAVLNKQQRQIERHLSEMESRLLTARSSGSGTSEGPAYHTQQIKDHIDRAFLGMREQVIGLLDELQTEMLKQFHLASEDVLDVDTRLTRRTDALTAAVKQLTLHLQEESNDRRRIAYPMGW